MPVERNNGDGADKAPLLNEYKVAFVKRRWPHTLLGGVRFPAGDDVPPYAYIWQFLLLCVPIGVGLLFTGLANNGSLSNVTAAVICGSIVVAIDGIVRVASFFIDKRALRTVGPIPTLDAEKGARDALAEEDEIPFDGVVGRETLAFVVPPRRHVAVALVQLCASWLICAGSVVYLLPRDLAGRSIAGAVTTTGAGAWALCVFGWIAVAVSQYPLKGAMPAEPGRFRDYDPLELNSLSRPFYVGAFLVFGLIARNGSDVLQSVDRCMHVVFAILPLLYALGTLPQLDALFGYAAEQVLVHLMGGSYAADDASLAVAFLLSAVALVVSVIVHVYWSTVAAFAFAGFAGCVLAHDVHGAIVRALRRSPTNAPAFDFRTGKRPKTALVAAAVAGVSALVAGAAAGLLRYAYESNSVASLHNARVALDVLVCVQLALFVLVPLATRPYLPLVPLRNPIARFLAPNGRGRRVLGVVHFAVLEHVAPWLLTCYAALFSGRPSTAATQFVFAAGFAFALRVAWQRPARASLVVVVGCVVIPRGVLAAGSSHAWWEDLTLGVQILLTAVCVDRFFEFCDKIAFVGTHLLTTATQKKQRFPHAIPFLVASALLSPVILAVVAIAAVLSVPLLPLFGIPLFFVAFPRPRRQWPSASAHYTANGDSQYYAQVLPSISAALSGAFDAGTLGDPQPGVFYLLRFQNKLVWVQVLDAGHGYRKVSIKGLELQETSCHTVEAARIDDVFAGAHGTEAVAHDALNILTPVDTVGVLAYSDARNVLTGIIDQPRNLKLVSSSFLKTLVWVFLRRTEKEFPERWREIPLDEYELELFVSRFPLKWYQHLRPGATGQKDPLVPLVLAVYAIVDSLCVPGGDASTEGPEHVFRTYCGNITPSTHLDWLRDDAELRTLAIAAYRLAFRLVYDQAVIGEIGSLDELKDNLVDYETNCYVGLEGERQWGDAVAAQRPMLFSIGFDKEKNVYSGRVLTIQSMPADVGTLNPECVRGIWASLAFELMYLTNDDDERFSIQAHKTLLRNIVVQSAAPPLGYPIFCSDVLVL